MRRLVAVVLVSLLALMPAAYAQQAAPAPTPAPAQIGSGSSKALAIAAGVVVGALIVSTPFSVRGATLLGAVAGGLLAGWWYDEHAAALALDSTRKAP